jgi:hypothetical protein
MPLWSFLVTLGAWAQSHPQCMLALCGTAMLLLGGVHLTRSLALRKRGPRL